MNESTNQQNDPQWNDSFPFVAPSKKLEFSAPIGWLKLGWQDIKQAPVSSLSYGILFLLFCSTLL